ncbi:MAG: hypothetical protein GX915_07185 [Clostridiales bacterium]|nr:hypothetical protein [Clostridiales bacterium]
MANVFKKLISKELGEVNYRLYSSLIKRSIFNKKGESQLLFNDMYEKLTSRDIKSIAKMHERLNDTMLLAFRISKNYFFAFLFYFLATLFIISRDLQPMFTAGSLILMSICFTYKTYEFIVNKFCYIDAQIVLVYKTVLDRIITNEYKKVKDGK